MNKKYTIIMVLSFVYGGFLLTSYAINLYSVLMHDELPGPLGIFLNEGVPGVRGASRPALSENMSTDNASLPEETGNATDIHRNITNRSDTLQRRIDPIESILSPYMLLSLFGGIICITNGLALRQLTHEKEVKKMREDLTELLLSTEEKLIIEELKKSGGEQTQRNLTEITGYSRVKTHRIIQKLEEKKIVKKIPNGQTNRITLEKG